MNMKFGLRDEAANRSARNNFLLRACVICVAIIGIIPFAVLMGELSSLKDAKYQDYQQWMDESQDIAHHIVCQQVAATCKTGWRRSTTGGKCFHLESSSYSYPEARDRCNMAGGTLATIASEQDNSDVLEECGDKQPCWIGLSRQGGSSTWAWDDGAPVSFTKWGDGEPNVDKNSDVAASLGFLQYAQILFKAYMGIAVFGLVSMLINIACLCSYCGCFYQGVTQKSTCCVLTAGMADSCCAILALISVIRTGIGLAAYSNGVSIASIIITIVEMLLLCAVAGVTFMMHGAVKREADQMAVQQQIVQVGGAVVVGQPVGGMVVTGQPVMAQPQAVMGTAIVM